MIFVETWNVPYAKDGKRQYIVPKEVFLSLPLDLFSDG